MPQTPSREEIERKAYEIYEQRGCQDGYAEQDWFTAERELNAMLTADERKKSASRIKAAVAQGMQQKSTSVRSGRN
jgi:hypothetical protein